MSGSIWYSRYVSEKKYKLLLFEHIFSTVFKIIVEIIQISKYYLKPFDYYQRIHLQNSKVSRKSKFGKVMNLI
jgi:hypothetical protein